MTNREAQEIIHLIEGSFAFGLGDPGRAVWRQGLLPKDYEIALEAAVMVARTMNKRPTLKDLLDVIEKRERERGWEQEHTKGLEEVWRLKAARPPAWVFGWAIARYRDHDHRLWPEQEAGYRQLGYSWDSRQLMSEQEQQMYADQGRTLSVEKLWQLIGQTRLDSARSPVPNVAEPLH